MSSSNDDVHEQHRQRALDELSALGADVRVSYDETTTRLHAKAWIFHRHEGYSTAYVGSSNLTHSAQVTGLEWNVRLSGIRNPDALAKIAAVFDSYWESSDFVPYDPEEFRANRDRGSAQGRVASARSRSNSARSKSDLLELLTVSREQGHRATCSSLQPVQGRR